MGLRDGWGVMIVAMVHTWLVGAVTLGQANVNVMMLQSDVKRDPQPLKCNSAGN